MKIKCLNCIHYSICALRVGGFDIKTLNEDCKDYLQIDKDVWVCPVKFGDDVWVIEDGVIYSAHAGWIEAYLTSAGVKWTIHYSYSDDTFGEPTIYSWSGTFEKSVFRTEENVKKYLEQERKDK